MNGYCPEGFLTGSLENSKSLSTPEGLKEAAESGTVLEATALLCDADRNIAVNLNGIRGIIPRLEGALGIAEGEVRDIALISRVGKAVSFTVTELTEDSLGRPLALLSRRIAQERCRREYIDRLAPGDIIPARVTHLESFGVFLDIGCGCPALLPIDSVSVSRISHPRDRFRCGEDIKVVVKSNENGRVTVSRKELLGTWEENAALFSQGETVFGTVRSVESYGIFVELTPNLAGLAEPKEGVLPGQCASVYIKSLLPDRMKVKLIIIDSFASDGPPHRSSRLFIEGDHIDRWVYSPPCCNKSIFTDFTVEKDSDRLYNK